jgi:ABC-2 type transport system ATP-binding protein
VPADPILEARRLTKRYAALTAISEVNFAIRPGDILGYLGPNGSGKSTAVKVLTGLLAPTTGQVLFRGQDINGDLVNYKRQVGYTPARCPICRTMPLW